jgi:hypothetical protein
MKTRPILFNGDMVRAILDGRKTQTRRVIKPQPHDISDRTSEEVNAAWQEGFVSVKCPYGAVGDLLWVRETHGYDGSGNCRYHADDNEIEGNWMLVKGWCPCTNMPRGASRITLEITGVRVERLQDISEDDAIAEGVEGFGDGLWRDYSIKPEDNEGHNYFRTAKESYQSLWQSINRKNQGTFWDANPWVWVIEFKPHVMNVDTFIAQKGW